MDVRQTMIMELYNRLTTDPALQALWPTGAVTMQERMAQPDTEFPYLVHRLDLVVPETSWALLAGTWYLDLWDHGSSRDRVWAIHARVIALMDQYIITPAGGEIVVAQISLRTDREGPTDAVDVYRLMLEWGLHLDRQADVEAILSR